MWLSLTSRFFLYHFQNFRKRGKKRSREKNEAGKNAFRKGRGRAQSWPGPRRRWILTGKAHRPPSLNAEGWGAGQRHTLYPVKVNEVRPVRRVNKISYGLQVIHSWRSESVRLLSLVEEQQNSIKE